jgi:hypothetical protein
MSPHWGEVQVERLRATLLRWIGDLFSGQYDEEYVERRWRVGLKHASIGLDQVYCNVAMSRIRTGRSMHFTETGPAKPLRLTRRPRS